MTKHNDAKQILMTPRRRAWTVRVPILLALLSITPVPGHSATAPTLSSDTDIATGGYYRLSWQLSEAAQDQRPQFQLQEAAQSDFDGAQLIYQGPDLARVISGQDDATRYYRVRARINDTTTPWSEPISVEVKHHLLSRALSFFAAGAVVFGATVFVIIKGARKARREA